MDILGLTQAHLGIVIPSKSQIKKPLYSFKEKKEILLHRLVSPTGKIKYKRLVTSPIRYAGGKSLAVGHIIELLPDNTKKLISPFFGGGSIEIACSKYLDIEVIGYDIFDILVNYWTMQINHPQELFRLLSEYRPTKEEYRKIKDELKKHWKKEWPGKG